MHDIKWIREHRDDFDRALARRGLPAQSQHLISIDERRRAIIRVLESWQATRNAASKEIGLAKKNKDEAKAQELMAKVAEAKTSIPKLEAEEKQVIAELEKALATIPNLPAADVPDGANETGNVEHHHFGAKRNYPYPPKQHFELGEQLGFMDFETAAKLSGARFVVLKSGLARMERALGQFMVDLHATEHGYQEIAPPLLVKDDVMYGTGQLPKFEEDQFYALSSVLPKEIESEIVQSEAAIAEVEKAQDKLTHSVAEGRRRLTASTFINVVDDNDRALLFTLIDGLDERRRVYSADYVRKSKELVNLLAPLRNKRWLIPTAEVPLTNLVRESIREEAELPLRFTAYTPCFRAEAGAAGKDTRGMIRQHQFNKVELVSITTPEQSKDEHERMLSCAEEVLRRLGLHYRVVTLCTGDMGFASQKTYDIEVWLPGQGMYREISSCSNCGDFQARRMAARYRARGQKNETRFVHTLNGSGTAVGRALIAVMETYQDEGGRIAVPDVLQGYMGGMKVVEKAA